MQAQQSHNGKNPMDLKHNPRMDDDIKLPLLKTENNGALPQDAYYYINVNEPPSNTHH